MKEFIEYLVKQLVNNPDEVEVTETQESGLLSYRIKVANEDMGIVIGKEGKNTIRKTIPFGDQQGNNNGGKSIMLGLFALIGFIILVYSIFVAVMGEPLASVADTVFIAALIGSFTLVGTIVSYLYMNR